MCVFTKYYDLKNYPPWDLIKNNSIIDIHIDGILNCVRFAKVQRLQFEAGNIFQNFMSIYTLQKLLDEKLKREKRPWTRSTFDICAPELSCQSYTTWSGNNFHNGSTFDICGAAKVLRPEAGIIFTVDLFLTYVCTVPKLYALKQ